jgi:L-threonylcarbamoyladenylate synthase
MNTRLIGAAHPGAINEASRVLQDGELVAFPTDTVYGVGAHAFQPAAVEKIYQAKGRPSTRPIPLLLASASDMTSVALEVPRLAWLLAERFWPGGLTLVLKAAPHLPQAVIAGGSTVAVRQPDHQVPLALIASIGAPLAATSANRSGDPDPLTAAEVEGYLAGRIALILDGGPCQKGVPSTVLDLTVTPPRVLRQGAIHPEILLTFIAQLREQRLDFCE